jgi:pimeloyl-ACP methyl ester carboxylesterase
MVRPDTRKLDPRKAHFWISVPPGLVPERRANKAVRPILYVHGATFPSALSIAHRCGGWSWRDAPCDVGCDVWAFDFLGYGYSGRNAEMSKPPEANLFSGAQDASTQIDALVRRPQAGRETIEPAIRRAIQTGCQFGRQLRGTRKTVGTSTSIVPR